MLARQAIREALCPCGCGGRAEDTLDPDSKWRGVAERCKKREAMALRARKQSKDDPAPESWLYGAVLRG